MTGILPSPSQLLQNELATLHFLRNSQTVRLYYGRLNYDAQVSYSRLKNARRSFKFASYVDVIHKHKERRVFFGGTMQSGKNGRYANISYSLLVANGLRRDEGALRKFHFDATFPGQTRKQDHPAFHLQYCGKLGPHLRKHGFGDCHIAHMVPAMSEPRIPYMPMSLALLLDLVLHEFPDKHSRKLRDQSAWRKVLMKNERLLLQPFYCKCVDILSGRTTNRQLWAEAFYV